MFGKSQIETSAWHKVPLKNLICQSGLFSLRHFDAQCLRSSQSEKRENEEVPSTQSQSKINAKLVFSVYAIFDAKCFKSLQSKKNAGMNNYLARSLYQKLILIMYFQFTPFLPPNV